MAVLGHIPVVGESFFAEGFVVRVIEAEPTRVVRIHVEAQAPVDAQASEAEPVAADDEAAGVSERRSA
jgi:Mg2+/Co2+ transporter CorC